MTHTSEQTSDTDQAPATPFTDAAAHARALGLEPFAQAFDALAGHSGETSTEGDTPQE